MNIGLSSMIATAVISYGIDRKTEIDPYSLGFISGIFAFGGLCIGEPVSAGLGAGVFNYAILNM